MAANGTVIDPFYLQVYESTKLTTCVLMGISFMLGIPGNLVVVLVHKT